MTGVCGSGIIECMAEMYLCGILNPGRRDRRLQGRAVAAHPAGGPQFSYLLHAGEPELRIHQNDVRAIQLAKAALYAGARLLMDHLDVERVDRITFAGAFGSHITPTMQWSSA